MGTRTTTCISEAGFSRALISETHVSKRISKNLIPVPSLVKTSIRIVLLLKMDEIFDIQADF